jgi:histidinol-phosphate aminotransferase
MPEMTRRQWLSMGAALAGGIFPSRAVRTLDQRRVRLSHNENPYGPSPRAIAAIQAHLDGLCRYVGDESDHLTKAIAARENISSEHIVLGEILDVLGLYLATEGGPGGEFIFSVPGYMALVDAVAPGGGVVVGVPLDDRLQNDLTAIAGKVNGRTRAVYLINPHNPTGTVSDAAQFIEFVRDISKRTLVIVDEAYLEFDPDFEKRSMIGLARSGHRVVVFRTFSKIYGLASLAIGYAIAPADLARSLNRAGIGMFFTLNRLAIVAATASLEDLSYVASIREKVVSERQAWHELLQTLKRRYADSQGNFIFFDAGRPQQDIAAALAMKGIEIGRVFPPFENWVRISIGLPQDNAITRQAVAELLR